MQALIENFSAQKPYIRASAFLLFASLGLPLCGALSGGPDWLSFLLGLPVYIALVVLTYHRLRDAALSGGWVVLMILVFNFGPSWDGPGPMHLYLGNFVNLIPVLMGWFTPSNFGANAKIV